MVTIVSDKSGFSASIERNQPRIDDMRWLLTIISDTGKRLTEATVLYMDDLHLDDGVPWVAIRSHPWRSLKTKRSERKVPLVDA